MKRGWLLRWGGRVVSYSLSAHYLVGLGALEDLVVAVVKSNDLNPLRFRLVDAVETAERL